MRTKKSTFFITSVMLFISMNLTAQIPNGDFENWSVDGDGILYPDGWQTTDSSVKRYTPACEGSYSMQVNSFNASIIVVGGAASLDFPFALRPVRFSACIKSTLLPGDTAYIYFSLWKGDSVIAAPSACTFKIDSSYSTSTFFDYPITYWSSLTPDSANILIMSGLAGKTHVGDNIIVDQLSLGFGTGIKESNNSSSIVIGQNFPNPAFSSTTLPLKLKKGSDVTIYLFDVLGKEIKRKEYGFLGAGEHDLMISVDDLPNGIYQIRLKSDENYSPIKKLLKLN